jgi:hypothetical protein
VAPISRVLIMASTVTVGTTGSRLLLMVTAAPHPQPSMVVRTAHTAARRLCVHAGRLLYVHQLRVNEPRSALTVSGPSPVYRGKTLS